MGLLVVYWLLCCWLLVIWLWVDCLFWFLAWVCLMLCRCGVGWLMVVVYLIVISVCFALDVLRFCCLMAVRLFVC